MRAVIIFITLFISAVAHADRLYNFRVCNHVMPVLAAAVVWKDPNTLMGKSEGWWAIPIGECTSLGNFPQRIFVYLEGGVPKSGKPTTIVNPHKRPLAKFCVEPNEQFSKTGADIRCEPPNQREFNHFDFSVDSTVWNLQAVKP